MSVEPGEPSGLDRIRELLAGGEVLVLTGAGISTESGIPDYRGPTGAARAASPMTYSEFIGSAVARQRYWARSFAGWPLIARARPNAGHRAVAALEAAGAVRAVITQNVDGLHTAAGSRPIELHGALARVLCLTCGHRLERATLQRRLAAANPDHRADEPGPQDDPSGALRPDGDRELDAGAVEDFVVVPCEECGGVLKPDVVFFGESVPRARVEECFARLEAARALLVLGSSLTVMSGYRFVRRAVRIGCPVAVVNQGPGRGDAEALVRVDAPLGAVLPRLLPVAPVGADQSPAT